MLILKNVCLLMLNVKHGSSGYQPFMSFGLTREAIEPRTIDYDLYYRSLSFLGSSVEFGCSHNVIIVRQPILPIKDNRKLYSIHYFYP